MYSCYICDTPFQLMNCVNWRYFNDTNGKADIYIGNHFFDCDGVADRIKGTKLFSNVFLFEFPKYKSKVNFILCKYKEFFKIRKALDDWTGGINNLNIEYDAIYLSIYAHFSFGVIQINPTADIVIYDDGIGTYLGNTQRYDFKKRRFIYHLFRLQFPNLDFDRLIVSNKTFYLLDKEKINYPVSELHSIALEDDKFVELLYFIFNFTGDNLYKERNIVYLTQPNDNKRKNYEKIEGSILTTLEDFDNRLLIRVHPRQRDFYFQDYLLDKKRSMWELIVLNEITESHILIGFFSTAQFIPKIMYNKEPLLVFTYKLFSEGFSEEEISQMDRAVEKLTSIYVHKERIKIVNDLMEIQEIVNGVK